MRVNEGKISRTFETYINGNRKDAAKAIRGFNRLELIAAITKWASIPTMLSTLCGDRDRIYDWEQFIFYAIDRHY
jgi:hypothetical protein